MGILDNLESAWDEEFQFESKPLIEKNNIGDPIIQGTHESDEFCLDEEVIDN
jgi:hypothetical protein